MKILDQSHEILFIQPDILQSIELAGRTCYKSEDKITKDSAKEFVKRLISNGHDAMLEFGYIAVKFITNRGITHELVRHRLFSFAQESTRYVKYDGIEVIRPHGDPNLHMFNKWETAMLWCESIYTDLLDNGWTPQQARDVLPHALKAEIVVGGNTREWRHALSSRCSKKAHPQMRALMLGLLKELQGKVPVLFDDIKGE